MNPLFLCLYTCRLIWRGVFALNLYSSYAVSSWSLLLLTMCSAQIHQQTDNNTVEGSLFFCFALSFMKSSQLPCEVVYDRRVKPGRSEEDERRMRTFEERWRNERRNKTPSWVHQIIGLVTCVTSATNTFLRYLYTKRGMGQTVFLLFGDKMKICPNCLKKEGLVWPLNNSKAPLFTCCVL